MDVAEVRGVAGEFDGSAGSLDAMGGDRLSALGFGGASAGRAYVARGDSLRAAVERITDQLSAWSRASAEISTALRASADRYQDSDQRAAARLR